MVIFYIENKVSYLIIGPNFGKVTSLSLIYTFSTLRDKV